MPGGGGMVHCATQPIALTDWINRESPAILYLKSRGRIEFHLVKQVPVTRKGRSGANPEQIEPICDVDLLDYKFTTLGISNMPYVQSKNARLYYETAGTGTPIIFVHEFSGDLWSWEKQMQHFSRLYKCVAYNARGYPPSDVPAKPAHYSHDQAVDDVAEVMRHLKIKKAHIVGCSMGSRTTLDFGLRYPRMCLSITMIGIGSGGDPRNGPQFKADAEARAKMYEEEGLAKVLEGLKVADNRIQLKTKNPRAFEEFGRRFLQHDAQGNAHISRRVMARRKSLYAMGKALKDMKVPAHVVVGDEDRGALKTGVFMKEASPAVRLSVVAATGHLVNLEEPDILHKLSEDFFALVESKKWKPRAV